MTINSTSLGSFDVPKSFPVSSYDAVMAHVSRHSETHADAHKAFAMAWIGLPYRFRAMEEHGSHFMSSVGVNSSPEMNERYRQDHDLFCFYATGLSALECIWFAFYCVACIVDKTQFPISSKGNLDFSSHNVTKRFATAFPHDEITTAMLLCLKSPEFTSFSNARNTLAHRGTPSRHHFADFYGANRPSNLMSNPKDLPTDWIFDFELSSTALEPHIQFVRTSVQSLVKAIEMFTLARL